MKQIYRWGNSVRAVWVGDGGVYPLPEELFKKYPHPTPGPRLQKRTRVANKARDAALRDWGRRMDQHVCDCIFGKQATLENIPRIE